MDNHVNNTLSDFDLDFLLSSAPSLVYNSENEKIKHNVILDSYNIVQNIENHETLANELVTQNNRTSFDNSLQNIQTNTNDFITQKCGNNPYTESARLIQNNENNHEMIEKSKYDESMNELKMRTKDYDLVKKQFAALGLKYAETFEENKKSSMAAIDANNKCEKLELEIKGYQEKLNRLQVQYEDLATTKEAQDRLIVQYTYLVDNLQKDVTQLKNDVKSAQASHDAKSCSLRNIKKAREEQLSLLVSVIEKKHPVDAEVRKLISRYRSTKAVDVESFDARSVDTGRGSSLTNYSPAYSANFSPMSTFSCSPDQITNDILSPPLNKIPDLLKSPMTNEIQETKESINKCSDNINLPTLRDNTRKSTFFSEFSNTFKSSGPNNLDVASTSKSLLIKYPKPKLMDISVNPIRTTNSPFASLKNDTSWDRNKCLKSQVFSTLKSTVNSSALKITDINEPFKSVIIRNQPVKKNKEKKISGADTSLSSPADITNILESVSSTYDNETNVQMKMGNAVLQHTVTTTGVKPISASDHSNLRITTSDLPEEKRLLNREKETKTLKLRTPLQSAAVVNNQDVRDKRVSLKSPNVTDMTKTFKSSTVSGAFVSSFKEITSKTSGVAKSHLKLPDITKPVEPKLASTISPPKAAIHKILEPSNTRKHTQNITETLATSETSVKANSIEVLRSDMPVKSVVNLDKPMPFDTMNNSSAFGIKTPEKPVSAKENKKTKAASSSPKTQTSPVTRAKQKLLNKSRYHNKTIIAKEIISHKEKHVDEEQGCDLEVRMILNKFHLDWDILSPLTLSPIHEEDCYDEANSDGEEHSPKSKLQPTATSNPMLVNLEDKDVTMCNNLHQNTVKNTVNFVSSEDKNKTSEDNLNSSDNSVKNNNEQCKDLSQPITKLKPMLINMEDPNNDHAKCNNLAQKKEHSEELDKLDIHCMDHSNNNVKHNEAQSRNSDSQHATNQKPILVNMEDLNSDVAICNNLSRNTIINSNLSEPVKDNNNLTHPNNNLKNKENQSVNVKHLNTDVAKCNNLGQKTVDSLVICQQTEDKNKPFEICQTQSNNSVENNDEQSKRSDLLPVAKLINMEDINSDNALVNNTRQSIINNSVICKSSIDQNELLVNDVCERNKTKDVISGLISEDVAHIKYKESKGSQRAYYSGIGISQYQFGICQANPNIPHVRPNEIKSKILEAGVEIFRIDCKRNIDIKSKLSVLKQNAKNILTDNKFEKQDESYLTNKSMKLSQLEPNIENKVPTDQIIQAHELDKTIPSTADQKLSREQEPEAAPIALQASKVTDTQLPQTHDDLQLITKDNPCSSKTSNDHAVPIKIKNGRKRPITDSLHSNTVQTEVIQSQEQPLSVGKNINTPCAEYGESFTYSSSKPPNKRISRVNDTNKSIILSNKQLKTTVDTNHVINKANIDPTAAKIKVDRKNADTLSKQDKPDSSNQHYKQNDHLELEPPNKRSRPCSDYSDISMFQDNDIQEQHIPIMSNASEKHAKPCTDDTDIQNQDTPILSNASENHSRLCADETNISMFQNAQQKPVISNGSEKLSRNCADYTDMDLFQNNDKQEQVTPIMSITSEKHSRTCADYTRIRMSENGDKQKQDTSDVNIADEYWKHNLLDRMIYTYGSIHKKQSEKSLKSKTMFDAAIATEIEKGVARCINAMNDPDNYMKSLNDVASHLLKHDTLVLISGVMFYLRKPERKGQFAPKRKDNNYFTKPAPTAHLIALIEITATVEKRNKKFWESVVQACEFMLFNLDKKINPSMDLIETVTHLVINMCIVKNDNSRLWIFLLDAMYTLGFKAMVIIKLCLELAPNMLPNDREKERLYPGFRPLVKCVVFLIHFHNCEDKLNKVQSLRTTLKKYDYHIAEENETTILFMIKEAIIGLRDIHFDKSLLQLTLLILAKRKGTKWCHTNLVQKILLPIMKGETNASNVSFQFSLAVIGELLKPYKFEMTVHCEEVVNLLIGIFEKTYDQDVKESVLKSLINMNMESVSERINSCLLNWNPPKISQSFEHALKTYVQRKTLRSWKRLYEKLCA